MIIVFPGCKVVSVHVCTRAFCCDYRSVCTCLGFNLEVNSAAEISSGPTTEPWVSPLASSTGAISKVYFCVFFPHLCSGLSPKVFVVCHC